MNELMQVTATVDSGTTNTGRVLVAGDRKVVLNCQGFDFRVEFDPRKGSYRLFWLDRDEEPVLDIYRNQRDDPQTWIAKEVGGTIETQAHNCPFMAAVKALWIMF